MCPVSWVKHIKKHGDGSWEYPNREELLKKFRLLDIEVYIERRQGTLREYLQNNRESLLREAESTESHCYDGKKILWWWITTLNLLRY